MTLGRGRRRVGGRPRAACRLSVTAADRPTLPACGLTRSVALAWRGRVRDPVGARPLGVVLLAIVLVCAVRGKPWRATPGPGRPPVDTERSRADRPDGRVVVYSRGSERPSRVKLRRGP
ncbi:MAG: DUF2752 domain-containing protein [Pseudonocardiaceae bacterium]|nr:MAG: DUF2752 domain-containing protein [Pseudonocardiaceae bacterium]